jgi:hypothetical protein
MISFFTLLTDDFQINVYNIASISLIIPILGFGSAIERWLSTGRISDLTTVILPIFNFWPGLKVQGKMMHKIVFQSN